MTTLDREIVRLLMFQVREEQARRIAIARALGVIPKVEIPTDEEVNVRIQELEELVKNNLTKKSLDSKM